MSKLNDKGNPDRVDLLGERVCAGEEAVVPQEASGDSDNQDTDMAANQPAEITNTRLVAEATESPQTEAALVDQEVCEWEEEPLTRSTEASIKIVLREHLKLWSV